MFLIKTKQNYYIRFKLNENYTQTTTGTTIKKVAKIRFKYFEYGGKDALQFSIDKNLLEFNPSLYDSKKEADSILILNSNGFTLSELKDKLYNLTNSYFVTLVFNNLIRFYKDENYLVDNITAEQIDSNESDCYKNWRLNEYRRYSKTKKVSIETVNTELRQMRIFFNRAVKQKWIKENIFKDVTFLKTTKKLFATFDSDNRKKLLDIIDDADIKNITIFALLTGCRRGEIINLEWSDIDFDNKIIFIRSKDDFKTKNRDIRTIPINSSMMKLLGMIERTESSYLFHDANGNKYRGDYIGKKFKMYLRIAGFDESLHFHSLRHTIITEMVKADENLLKIQSFIGHKSYKTTLKYTHLNIEDYRDLAESINTVVL